MMPLNSTDAAENHGFEIQPGFAWIAATFDPLPVLLTDLND
jgi:hypothetical protein